MKKWVIIFGLALSTVLIVQAYRHRNKEPQKALSEAVIPNAVNSLCLNRDTLYIGMGDGLIEVWDLESKARVFQFVAHDGAVRKLSCTEGGLVSVGARGSIAAGWLGSSPKRFGFI